MGHDVLVDGIFPHLEAKDIFNLSCTSRTLNYYTSDPSVWHDLYFATFGGQPNPFTSTKWPEMYKWRSRAGMFTWGNLDRGRLGYLRDSVPKEAISNFNGVCIPQLVTQLKKLVVSDVAGAGFSFALLTGDGQIFTMGQLSERIPPTTGGHVGTVVHLNAPLHFPRGPLPHARIPRFVEPLRGPAVGVDHPPENPESAQPAAQSSSDNNTNKEPKDEKTKIDYLDFFSASELAKPKPLDVNSEQKIKFKSISTGRSHLLALDEAHNIWTWDYMYAAAGVRLQFPFNTDGQPNKLVRKLCAGWNFSSALIEDVGIAVWFHNTRYQKLPVYEEDIPVWKKEAKAAPVEPVIVPYTNASIDSDDYIVDLMAGEDFLIYLTSDGKLYSISTRDSTTIETESRELLKLFLDELDSLSTGDSESKTKARFVKLSGSYHHFAAFSNNDHVLIGKGPINASTTPQVIPKLQKAGCFSVATGDHHFLALLHGGKLLAWGRESMNCGDLGLGPQEKVLALGGHREGRDLVVSEPLEVDVGSGKVLAIAAGGWHSCAIITTESIEE